MEPLISAVLGSESRAFQKYALFVINMARKYNLTADELIPDPTTISRHIPIKAEELRETILPELIGAIKVGNCAATTDLWIEKHNRTFYTVTVHYINDKWELVNRVLFVTEFPNKPKTAENILNELSERLEKFGIPKNLMNKITFVTDRGTNIASALNQFERFNCVADLINSTLKYGFTCEETQVSSISKTIEKAKDIVSHLNRTGYCTELPKRVPKEAETRWDSELTMLRSVVNRFNDIVQMLKTNNKLRLIDGFDLNIATNVMNFLTIFEEAKKHLEEEKSPTLYLVILWIGKILQLCSENTNDNEEMIRVKQRIIQHLQKHFVPKTQHLLATFLIPSFRQLNIIDKEDRDLFMKELRSKVSLEAVTLPPSNVLPHNKRLKTMFKKIADPSNEDEFVESRNEVDIYMDLQDDVEDNDDILKWWARKGDMLPNLQKLAKQVFAIPATSTYSKGCASKVRSIIHGRRNRMKPQVMDALLFLHYNLHSDEEYDLDDE